MDCSQAPLCMGFSRQEYWSGLPCPSPKLQWWKISNSNSTSCNVWFSLKVCIYIFLLFNLDIFSGMLPQQLSPDPGSKISLYLYFVFFFTLHHNHLFNQLSPSLVYEFCEARIHVLLSLNLQSLVDLLFQQSESERRSVVSDSLWTHGLYDPWNSPGQNTGVGSLSLLQGILPTQGSNPGLPHCGQILYQLSHNGGPRILEWIAYPSSSGYSRPRNQTVVSCIAGRFFTNWAISEALLFEQICIKRLLPPRCVCWV